MAKKKETKTPTAARKGDTLDNLPTFSLPRELYESERKEHVIAVRARLSELKSLRTKTAAGLNIPVSEEREVSRVIAMYEGDDGILALWHNDAEEEEHTAKEVKSGGKDHRQREMPLAKVPSESSPETRASSEPIGVAGIDRVVDAVKPMAPSDFDWDAFRREVVGMDSDARTQILEYAERWHQHQNLHITDTTPAPLIPGSLHALFTDLSPAYAQAMGQREDVVYRTDMERAMARAAARKKKAAGGQPDGKEEQSGGQSGGQSAGLTGKQMAALRAVSEGHGDTLSAAMYRKLVSLGLVLARAGDDFAIIPTEAGRTALAAADASSETIATPDEARALGEAAAQDLADVPGEIIPASAAGIPVNTASIVFADDQADEPPLQGTGVVQSITAASMADEQADENDWSRQTLRVPGEEPVAPIRAE